MRKQVIPGKQTAYQKPGKQKTYKKAISVPGTRPFSYSLPPELTTAVADLARVYHISQSEYVRRVLESNPEIAAQLALLRSASEEEEESLIA